jgi:hypothetical protein
VAPVVIVRYVIQASVSRGAVGIKGDVQHAGEYEIQEVSLKTHPLRPVEQSVDLCDQFLVFPLPPRAPDGEDDRVPFCRGEPLVNLGAASVRHPG